MTLTEAMQKVVDSNGDLVLASTQIPGDVIVLDPLLGWMWQKKGIRPSFMHPSIMLGNWMVGEKA